MLLICPHYNIPRANTTAIEVTAIHVPKSVPICRSGEAFVALLVEELDDDDADDETEDPIVSCRAVTLPVVAGALTMSVLPSLNVVTTDWAWYIVVHPMPDGVMGNPWTSYDTAVPAKTSSVVRKPCSLYVVTSSSAPEPEHKTCGEAAADEVEEARGYVDCEPGQYGAR